ncbi:hypothetical protein [Arthrobacter sp. M4]|uniref:hypothetical protein n=1 Tax=Arthrobacter sp. M4 TaxID=218160 RepID=UPI001CDCFD91|nr:hypothetical protein [Arthrobacter sp. M4]MCA4132303.1 hypothetical protein [Arthrobacter sp. M4]
MAAVVVSVGAALAACSVNVPDPAFAPATTTSTPIATPSITPGHDAEAVAARDMTMGAGETLAAGVPVGISDSLKEAEGWKQVRQNVQGENRYTNGSGCTVTTRVRTNQGPLAVSGDDKASTAALFQYLDPSILPEYLRMDTLRWGGEEGKPGPRVEVLSLEGTKHAGSKATAIFARVFGKAGSSIYVSVSCPKPSDLDKARQDVISRLPVVPPTS